MRWLRALLGNPRRERAPTKAGDALAIGELAKVAHVDSPLTIRHYLYFPEGKSADAAARELKQRGFTTEERLGADDTNWLVLAIHWVVPTEKAIASTRAAMEALAAGFGGEYDGWEAEVPPDTQRSH